MTPEDLSLPRYVSLLEGVTRNTVSPVYSVVVPFYNEEVAAPRLLQEILAVLARLDDPAECLCIDDGSSDGTAAVLNAFAAQSGSPVRVIAFSKNRGQAAALWVGLHEARGRIIITLDGDGQNDPGDIPRLLDALTGADMVVGVRQNRRDNASRRWMSMLANAVRARVLGDGMRDSGCALKAFRREVVASLIPIRTLYSFIPAMAVAGGFRTRQVPVQHRARTGGRSSYGALVFLWRPLVDLVGMWWFSRRAFPQVEQPRNGIGEQKT
jgi:glycosyltransferase involved in cell wall biosynthesis